MLSIYSFFSQSISGWFNVYRGTGVRGLSVAFSSGTPQTITLDQWYTLSITVPAAASRQLLPLNVSVTALRIGRMFGTPRVMATLANSAPTTIVGSTAFVNISLPSNITNDWLSNHVTFQVVDATPVNNTPWGYNATVGVWGRTPYVAVATPCLSFKGYRATLRAHCDADDIPTRWRALCSLNCSSCAAANGTWVLGAYLAYDIGLGGSGLSSRPVEMALAKSIFGSFFTNAISMCIPNTPGDTLDANDPATATDAVNVRTP